MGSLFNSTRIFYSHTDFFIKLNWFQWKSCHVKSYFLYFLHLPTGITGIIPIISSIQCSIIPSCIMVTQTNNSESDALIQPLGLGNIQVWLYGSDRTSSKTDSFSKQGEFRLYGWFCIIMHCSDQIESQFWHNPLFKAYDTGTSMHYIDKLYEY